ncbi:MAG TPA: enoyl-CoA hydratase/isomerase family protein [bacterium]|nr:enoyl-CoA hydratase/isomerase family protein [bacterium]
MSSILFQKEGPVAWIVLNDPDRLNALSAEMGVAIAKLVPQINRDQTIRVVVLTGSGRAFSAGGNLDIIEARARKKAAVNRSEMLGFYGRFLSILKIEVPVIAMINGPAIGAAFCMTMACDLRTASTEAKMGVNFVKLGLSPGMGATFLLPHVLGAPTALDLLLTGRTVGAEEALRRGMIHHLFAPEVLREETARIAREIAQNAPVAVKISKRGVLNHRNQLKKSLLFESKGQSVCFKTRDLLEGVQAIRAKRPPAFSGT